MLRLLMAVAIAVLATATAAGSVERYFAGEKEISKADYYTIAPYMLQGTEMRRTNEAGAITEQTRLEDLHALLANLLTEAHKKSYN